MSDGGGRIEAHAQRLFKGLCRNGNGTLSFNCPAHDDGRASGSLAVSQNGRPLLKCHAGCTNREIAQALGFKADRDLYSALDGRLNGKSRTPRKVVVRGAVRDAQKKAASIPDATTRVVVLAVAARDVRRQASTQGNRAGRREQQNESVAHHPAALRSATGGACTTATRSEREETRADRPRLRQ